MLLARGWPAPPDPPSLLPSSFSSSFLPLNMALLSGHEAQPQTRGGLALPFMLPQHRREPYGNSGHRYMSPPTAAFRCALNERVSLMLSSAQAQ